MGGWLSTSARLGAKRGAERSAPFFVAQKMIVNK
jgi:hypothetical protein